MWLRLTTAQFTTNIGTLNQWSISTSGSGFTYSGPSFWDKEDTTTAYSGTITILSGYTLNSISVSMGGTSLSNIVTDNGDGTHTINIASVIGDIIITVDATGSSSGGGGSEGDDDTTDPTPDGTVLVSSTGAILQENTAMSTTSSTPTANTAYYTYQFIPVVGGTTYRIQYGRRIWELDSNKAELNTFAAHNDVEDYTFTVGDTTAYISVTVKTTEIDPAELTLETIS